MRRAARDKIVSILIRLWMDSRDEESVHPWPAIFAG